MYTSEEVRAFIESYVARNELTWVNDARVSDDWKARLYEHSRSGRQFAIYDRQAIIVRLEHEISSLDGARRLDRCPVSHALNGARSHFPGSSGVCYETAGIEVLERLLDRYFERAEAAVALKEIEQQFDEEVEKALQRSREERRRRLAAAPRLPRQILVFSTAFVRNSDVVAEVLDRAAGRCECCLKDAPFVRARTGAPYLEVHHRVRLADRGEDTVENAIALCPNCHRQMHYG